MTHHRKLIRVLVADDSQLARELLREVIDAEADMIVVGTASTGRETLEKVERLRPDLVTLDVVMPDGDGISAAKSIMARHPTPLAVVTAAPIDGATNLGFDALAAGAVEVLPKPGRSVLDEPAQREAFARRLRQVAEVGVVGIRGPRAAPVRGTPQPAASAAQAVSPPSFAMPARASLIALGASTGGPPCVRTLLAGLDPTSAPPIVLVQHMSREFIPGFAAWLSNLLLLKVSIAATGVSVRPGHVYVAPGDRHLTIDESGTLLLDTSPAIHHQRPAADVLFHTVAGSYGARAVGVLLTGMGEDGAEGLAAMREAGAATIAQDEASCVVYGMPKAAIDRGAACLTANPLGIAWLLRQVKAFPSVVPQRRPIA
jgi:two-component system chemotaxis response regulator CheB